MIWLAPLLASATATMVYTDVGEVRACTPLDGGDFLVGTGGGLVRVDARGATKAVWTAVDGLPGTRIDGLTTIGDRIWVATEAGAAAITLEAGKLAVVRRAGTTAVRDVARFAGADYLALADGGVTTLGGRAIAFAGTAKLRTHVAALAVADGALWAGTAAGLYRLDGGAFERVTLEPGVSAEVTSLYADGTQLWIATTAGLYVREGATVKHLGGGELRRVTRLDGEIVAASLGAGLVRVDRGRLVAVVGAPRELVLAQAIAERAGAACAGGLDGLWLRARAEAPWIAARTAAGPPSNDISALAVAGTQLWVGTFDRGLSVYEAGAWRRVTDRAIDPRINALLVDAKGRLWIATAAGLSVIDGARISQLTRRDGLPGRSVLALAQLRDGRILIGTTSGAAIIGDGRPVVLASKQHVEAKNVWAVTEDEEGWLWLGTTTGLFRGRAEDASWTRYSVATGHLRDDWVMALAARDHALWVGTYKAGITRFDAAGGDTPMAVPVGEGWINPGGLRWVGDTLYAATMEGLRVGARALQGVPGRDVTATATLGTTLWIATRRGLVARPL